MSALGKTKFFIYLSDDDRAFLNDVIKTQNEETAMRAKILLASDFNNPIYRTVSQISSDLGVTRTTIQNVRARYASLGLRKTVISNGIQSPEHRAYITPDKRKQILDIIHEQPPIGQRRWTIELIREECIKRCLFNYVAWSAISKFIKDENIDLTKASE